MVRRRRRSRDNFIKATSGYINIESTVWIGIEWFDPDWAVVAYFDGQKGNFSTLEAGFKEKGEAEEALEIWMDLIKKGEKNDAGD